MTGSAMKLYFDYNATAPVRAEVRAAVEPLLFGPLEAGGTGNPSSIHWAGQAARRQLERARSAVARALGRRPGDVIFTSGGTEADNLALLGVALHPSFRPGRVLISCVEHPAVLAAAARLETLGVTVTRLPVDARGRLDLARLQEVLDAGPPAGGGTLVSVMAVNNETGVCSPVDEVRALASAAGAILHVDAVQAAGRIPLPLAADLITLSGHKLGGLPGTGALVTRSGIALESTVVGGPQERGHRAGTEFVAGAVALATALELAISEQPAESRRLGALRDRLDAAIGAIPGARIVGGGAPRVAGTTCAVFSEVDGDAVLQALDLEGIAASSGSACSSGSLEPSHVLLAMGIDPREALSAVRFSFGHATRTEEVERLIEILPRVVSDVRARAADSAVEPTDAAR